jgi:uncharacterized membrane protein YfcA
MELIVIVLVAFLGAVLSFISGFGLGTLLLPAMMLVYSPIEAIAVTAVVHMINTMYKLILVAKDADKQVVFRFGFWSVIGSLIGATIVTHLVSFNAFWEGETFIGHVALQPLNLIIASIIVMFALLEWIPATANLSFSPKWFPVGGLLSGFFGGLSGHQGALRSAFLIRAGLTKEAFIGSRAAIAALVDLSRLFVYSALLSQISESTNLFVICAAAISSMVGANVGNRIAKKIALNHVQSIVAISLLMFALLLGLGKV